MNTQENLRKSKRHRKVKSMWNQLGHWLLQPLLRTPWGNGDASECEELNEDYRKERASLTARRGDMVVRVGEGCLLW